MKIVKLTSICDFQGGTQPPKNEWNSELKEGYVRMLQIRDFTQRHKDYSEYVRDKPTLKKCKDEDVLIGRYGASIGKICTGLTGAYNVALIKTIPDKTKLDTTFLLYILKGESFQSFIQNIGSRAAQAGFNKTDLSNFEIPLPPLEIQQKIASILDAADTLRQKDKALLAKYDELTQSLFLDMFGDPVKNEKGWKEKELGSLIEITSSKRIFKDEYVDNGVPFYRTKEIVELSKGNKISLELFISENRYNEIKQKFEIPEIGDILMSAVGTIGVMWTVDSQNPFYFKDGNLVWLKSSKLKSVNSEYLKRTLNYLIEYEKDKLAEGGAYNALTIAKLNKLKVLIAPLELQNQFAERVKVIETQKAQAQASLVKAEELFNSLLQRAFNGELV